MGARLELRDVTVGHGHGTAVLDGASLVVDAGARVALLGANGAGKSTLLRTLVGALKPTRGQVCLDDDVLRHDRAGLRAHRRRVQLVLQEPDDQLFSADVFQDISFGPTNMDLPEADVRERVAEAMDLLAITHLAERPTHQISYGERKRVATAGAVAMRPDVLLLDEPTAGLDPVGTDQVTTALARLHARGTSLLVATHDVDMALAWADQVAVVVDGGIVQGPVTLLTDADLIARAHLRLPWAARVAQELDLSPLPRTADALVAALKAREAR